MEEETIISKPRNRSGGVFVKPEEVKLHANDFEFLDKVSQLEVNERCQIEKYTDMCMKEAESIDCNTYMGETLNHSWNEHYSTSRNHFPLKNYIIHAFPMLSKIVSSENYSCIMECGCGTGSVLLPLIHNFNGNNAFIGFDVSDNALTYFKEHPDAQQAIKENKLYMFEYDISRNYSEAGVNGKKLKLEVSTATATMDLRRCVDSHLSTWKHVEADVMLLIFVLSALPSVNAMCLCLKRLWGVMKVGGLLLFRDYGVADHNFFRFLTRDGNEIKDICFRRSDGTTQVFFEKKFTERLFELCGFRKVENGVCYHCNRLHNRKNGKTMDKVFVNGVFEKVGPE